MTSGPGDRRDESVQFSLKKLLELEDERLAEQTRERQAREAATARDRAEAERRRLADAEANARAQVEEQERRRRSDLEELARREAMQKAIVEQSRLEVEVRARADERELERRHEVELLRLRGQGTKTQLGALTFAALLGGGAMLLVTAGVYFGVTAPIAQRRLAELEQSVSSGERREDELRHRFEDQRKATELLERKLADKEAELVALRTKAKAPPSTAAPHPPSKHGPGPTSPGPAEPPVRKDSCLKGDPMCG